MALETSNNLAFGLAFGEPTSTIRLEARGMGEWGWSPCVDLGVRLSAERGLPHPNTLTLQLPTVFIGLRPTGLPSTVKEFVISVVSARLGQGVHDVAKVEIAEAIRRAGGSVSRSGLKLALAELCQGTARVPPLLLRVSPGRFNMRTEGPAQSEVIDCYRTPHRQIRKHLA